jgi:geranylgeranyl diphosphate synthase, type II
VMDIEAEGHPPTAELVEAIHRAKTGALITTSIVSGGLYGIRHMRGSMGLGGGAGRRGREASASTKADFDPLQAALQEHHAASADTIARLRTFGEKAGLAFQIVDDVLDMTQSSAELGKTAGKDTASIKATWPAVFGIDQSLKDAKELIADAFAALDPFGKSATPLKSLAQYLVERKH